MKTSFIYQTLLLLLLSAATFAQSIEINPSSSSSSIFTGTATDKGILVPRMTAAQKGAIASPAAGLLIYQTDAPAGFYYHNGTGWTNLGGTASELEKITESTKVGHRILGRNPVNYGNIGNDAIDLSLSETASSTMGATGINSFAAGFKTTASGIVSTALGAVTTASGDRSIAMGNGTIASGESSTALNHYTTASGQYATSLGLNTIASGQSSTAIGQSTTASGQASVALNLNTTAKSFAETAVGTFNTDYTPLGATSYNSADRAFGVGIGLHSGGKKDGLIVYKDGTLAFDKLTTAPATATDRFYILNNKIHYNGAEVGGASELQKITEGGNTGWRILGRNADNYGNIGSGAVDFSLSNSGSATKGATGENATAMGSNTTASGAYSIALGYNSLASGEVSSAVGSFATATGIFSVSMGRYTYASGANSTAIGASSQSKGVGSTAIGNGTTALGMFSTAMGNTTYAKSRSETVLGQYNDTLLVSNSENWFSDANRVFTVGTGTAINSRKTAFVIQQNGRVGIGTNNTALTKALLEVNGHVNYNGGNYGWFNSSGSGGTSSGASDYSIWASARVGANEFNAFSDVRIKDIVGLSSNTNDLKTLSKIKITDYTMKDKVQYGDKAFKKVIAQELKQVYPQAVNVTGNFIPDIYQKATIANGWITLRTDLVKGDLVRIITLNSTKELTIEEVAEGKFKVAAPDGEVFVYGKQVNDFHTVDYEALSMLNISATQALLKRIEELEAKNAGLTNQVKEMAGLKNDIEAIKAQLSMGAVGVSGK